MNTFNQMDKEKSEERKPEEAAADACQPEQAGTQRKWGEDARQLAREKDWHVQSR